MVCESCKVVVRDTLKKMDLTPTRVELGEVDIKEKISADDKRKLNTEFKKSGLELVESRSSIIIEQIKMKILEYISTMTTPVMNFSDYLARELGYDYKYLSNLFSDIEAVTIRGYMTAVRVERAKEMMLLDDLTVSEIAQRLHYSTVSHFSDQFKRSTGFSPSQFKEQKSNSRKAIHKLIE